jgi:hypothetical protein
VLFEFYTFNDFVGDSIDMVENTTTNDRVDCFVLPLANSVDRTTRFEYCFRLPVLYQKDDTEMFQVLIVLS